VKHNSCIASGTAIPRTTFGFCLSQARVVLLLPVFLAILLLGVGSAGAATLHCGASSSGDGSGSDWNNMCDFGSVNLTRGDTYYLMEGSYGSKTFSTPVSGTAKITIKKATAADHGTDTGWSDSMGDAIVQFGVLTFSSGYFIVDGNSPYWSYGIKIIPSRTAGQAIYFTSSGNNNTVKGIEVDCSSCSNVSPTPRGIYTNSVDNILVENVWVHHTYQDCVKPYNGSNLTFDHFYCSNRQMSPESIHGDAFEIVSVSNLTIRYSKFNWNGQQIFFGGNVTGANGRFDFYGNTHYGGASSGQGICRNSSGTGGPGYVYNNSFYNLNTAIIESGMNYADIRNNIFVAGNARSINAPNMHDNYYTSDITGYSDSSAEVGGDPFVNAAGGNFHLASATRAGDGSIGPAYQSDPDGKVRGADGTWDRGAFEFDSGSSTVRPSAPYNLSVN
jgi:hypothetical protein